MREVTEFLVFATPRRGADSVTCFDTRLVVVSDWGTPFNAPSIASTAGRCTYLVSVPAGGGF